ncbi:hypothetical protein [Algicella marina]|uniref:hypothetical protein n=1 Tax=Algicella marina TaxID=2683284 RepID=UPI0024E021F4|nr:hypothetical protein [Algicella marina]
MIPLVFAIAGALLGWFRAARAGGRTADKLQYATAHAIAFAILGLFVGIVAVRTGLL